MHEGKENDAEHPADIIVDDVGQAIQVIKEKETKRR